MNNKDQELLGLLGGGLSAAAVHYSRGQDNLDRRIDRVDDRSRDALSQINRWMGSGTVGRLLFAAVQDVISGIAMSSPAPQTPTVVPSTSVVSRPDISGLGNATGTQWPPVVGTYDDTNRNLTVGELTKFALALTYEEVRAAIMALVLASPPSLAAKAQIFNALNALIHSLTARSATWEQYKAAWDALFDSVGQLSNPHRNPARVPAVSSFGNQVASVSLLTGSTDEVSRFRVTAAVGPGVATGTNLFTVAFASEYRADLSGGSQPIAPIVLAERLAAHEVLPVSVTSTGYSVVLTSGSIPSGSSLDFKVLTSPGVAPG